MGQDLLPDELLSVFGRTLSLNGNGDILSVGAAPFNTNNDTSGYVRIYQFNGTNWVQYGEDIYGDYLYDDQGIVSLNNDGNTIVIGAPSIFGSSGGYVRVYNLDDDGICDDLEISGCTDEIACNYNENATGDDGSCIFVESICESCENGQIIDNDVDNDGVCDDLEISGCSDETI